jgi:hypothetical protein
MIPAIERLRGECERLRVENKRLRGWLKDARHKQHCCAIDPYEPSDKCTCGLTALCGEEE